MIKSFEIYFRDLNDEAKKEALKFYEIQSPDQANLDMYPISIIEIEKSDLNTVINEKTGVWEGNPTFSLPVSN